MRNLDAVVLVGSRYHDPWLGGGLLKQLLKAEGLAAMCTDQGSILTPERLTRIDLVVFYCEGRWDAEEPASRRLTPAQEAALVDYVQGGGGFLGVHGATVFREEYARYRKLLGGHFMGHGPMREFTVTVETPGHPVTEGVSAYTVFDEPYEVERYPGSTLLLAGEWAGDKHPLGWARTAGTGRVCYLANGHDKRSLETLPVQRLFRNAARWCRR